LGWVVNAPQRVKRCSTCREELAISFFWRNAANTDGMQSQCKGCMTARAALRQDRRRRDRLAEHAAEVERRKTDGKPCARCHLIKPFGEFRDKRPDHLDGVGSYCWHCQLERKRIKYSKRPIEKRTAYQRAYIQANRQEVRTKRIQQRATDRAELADSYVAKLILGKSKDIKAKQLPKPIIDLKRQQIEVKRLSKALTTAIRKTKDDNQ
jgi:hypothetical protein